MMSAVASNESMSSDLICETSPICGRNSRAAWMALCEWYSAGQNLMEVFLIMKSSSPGSSPPSLASSNGPETCLKNPISTSKMGAGQVSPSAASMEATNQISQPLAHLN